MLDLFGKIFKSSNQRRVDAYQKIVNKINAHEDKSSSMSESDFKNLSISENPTEQEIIEVFSAVREAAKRTIGLRHFDCQLIGGLVLNGGNIAEMKTGEGKTLVATLPAILNALSGKKTFVITVNDYLAQRDADWMKPVYEYFGLKVKGLSMIDEGIFDGDIAVIRKTNNVENGKIAAVLTQDNEVTLKTVKFNNNKVILIPANQSYQTKEYNVGEIQVQGTLSGIIRKYI